MFFGLYLEIPGGQTMNYSISVLFNTFEMQHQRKPIEISIGFTKKSPLVRYLESYIYDTWIGQKNFLVIYYYNCMYDIEYRSFVMRIDYDRKSFPGSNNQ